MSTHKQEHSLPSNCGGFGLAPHISPAEMLKHSYTGFRSVTVLPLAVGHLHELHQLPVLDVFFHLLGLGKRAKKGDTAFISSSSSFSLHVWFSLVDSYIVVWISVCLLLSVPRDRRSSFFWELSSESWRRQKFNLVSVQWQMGLLLLLSMPFRNQTNFLGLGVVSRCVVGSEKFFQVFSLDSCNHLITSHFSLNIPRSSNERMLALWICVYRWTYIDEWASSLEDRIALLSAWCL